MPSTEDSKKDEVALPKIRTFQTDAQRYIKDKNLSPAQVAARSYASQQRQATGAPSAPPKAPVSLTKKLLIVGGVIGIVALGVGGWTLISAFLKPAPTPQAPTLQIPQPLVFAESQVILETAKDDTSSLQKQIITERGKIRAPGSLEYLPLTIMVNKNTSIVAPPSAAIKLLGWDAPQSFVDQLISPTNVFVYFGPQNRDMTFVFTVRDFERALASLYGWEKTLPRDLRPYMSGDIPSSSLFQDEIIKNHSARVLKAGNDQVLLGYAIFNKKYVILATSREALATVLGRFIALPPQ